MADRHLDLLCCTRSSNFIMTSLSLPKWCRGSLSRLGPQVLMEWEAPSEERCAITPICWVNVNSPNTLPSSRVHWKVLNQLHIPDVHVDKKPSRSEDLSNAQLQHLVGWCQGLGGHFREKGAGKNGAWMPTVKRNSSLSGFPNVASSEWLTQVRVVEGWPSWPSHRWSAVILMKIHVIWEELSLYNLTLTATLPKTDQKRLTPLCLRPVRILESHREER